MTRYLLDTNIIGSITKPMPSEPLVARMSEQAGENLWIASLVLAEIRFGFLQRPAGRRRGQLEKWFAGPEGPQSLFAGRILPFDQKAALIWSRLMFEGESTGPSPSALDMILASIAQANHCVVVTDNERDFAGLSFINPVRPQA